MTLFAILSLLAADTARLTYFGDVRPLFEKSCYGCHAHGVKMGSLDLETWEGVQRGGNNGTIVVPGQPRESRLYTMLMGEAAPAMPMDGKVLPPAQIEAVRTWIAQGADPGTTASKPKTPRIYSMALAPNGRVVIGRFQTIEVMEAASKKTLGTATGHAEVVRALAVSKDLIAAGGGIPGRKGEVKLWNLSDLSPKATITGHADCIYAVAFSPDGKLLATASYDKLIKLWDVATGQEVRTLKDHIDAVYTLAFTPDGQRLLSGGADRTIKIWNPPTGERLYTLSEPTDGINSIALSPDGKIVAAAGLDKQIRLWRLGEKNAELLQTHIAHEDQILKLAWSADGKTIASSSADKSLKLYQAADLTEIKTHGGQSDWVYGLEFLPDGSLIAGRFDGTWSLYANLSAK
jgi:WD40 repeat protein